MALGRAEGGQVPECVLSLTGVSVIETTALKSYIREVPDFPSAGINFKDITPLLADPQAFRAATIGLAAGFAPKDVDVVVGIESRGFIFGASVAERLDAAFVPARKPNKLPWRRISVEYKLEYGTDVLEMHEDAIAPGARVVIVDDLLATGGTSWAARELVHRQGGEVLGCAFVIELSSLRGRARLGETPCHTLVEYA